MTTGPAPRPEPEPLGRSLGWFARAWARSTRDGFAVMAVVVGGLAVFLGAAVGLGWLIAGRPGVVVAGALALLVALVATTVRAVRLWLRTEHQAHGG